MDSAAPRDAALRPVDGTSRYSRTAQALHWLTALLVAAVLPLAWIATGLAKEDPARPVVFQFHKSVGLTILMLVTLRILWRARHPPPPDTVEPAGLALIGRINHGLLYAVFLLMPVSGYLLSAYNGNMTQFFYLFPIPGFAKDKALQEIFASVHRAGQYAVYALVGLHVLATLWHAAIRRDAVLARMLPRRSG